MLHKIIKVILHPIHYLKSWEVGIILIASLALGLYGLRANNLKMVELRNRVVEVDKSGGDVKGALQNLSTHVFNHMNTSVELDLKYSFDRAVDRAEKEAAAQSKFSDLYLKAEKECNKPGVPGTIRAQCVQDYVNKHAPEGSNPKPLELPDKRLYRYSFSAPVWSSDLAGISLLVAGLSVLLICLRFITRPILKIVSENK